MISVNTIGEAPPALREIFVDSEGSAARWCVPVETPVAFVFNRRNYAVMLATPQDLLDYAAGFSLTERIADSVDDIEKLDIVFSERGVDLRISLTPERLERFDLRQRRRNLPGVAGCGACGLENADVFFEPLPRVAEKKVSLSPLTVNKAIDELADHQTINQKTRSVHAAAWVDNDRGIIRVREDIGRHNALDKLLGSLALSVADMANGFVLMSSRCSYELVEKAARRGVTAMASLSGPTSFAIEKAHEVNMALYTRSPSGVVAIAGRTGD